MKFARKKSKPMRNLGTQSHGSYVRHVFDKIARLPKIAKPPKDGDAKPGV